MSSSKTRPLAPTAFRVVRRLTGHRFRPQRPTGPFIRFIVAEALLASSPGRPDSIDAQYTGFTFDDSFPSTSLSRICKLEPFLLESRCHTSRRQLDKFLGEPDLRQQSRKYSDNFLDQFSDHTSRDKLNSGNRSDFVLSYQFRSVAINSSKFFGYIFH